MPTGHHLRRAPEPAIPRVAGHPTTHTPDLCGDPGRLSQYLARIDTAADEFRRLARACGFPVDPDHDTEQPEPTTDHDTDQNSDHDTDHTRDDDAEPADPADPAQPADPELPPF